MLISLDARWCYVYNLHGSSLHLGYGCGYTDSHGQGALLSSQKSSRRASLTWFQALELALLLHGYVVCLWTHTSTAASEHCFFRQIHLQACEWSNQVPDGYLVFLVHCRFVCFFLLLLHQHHSLSGFAYSLISIQVSYGLSWHWRRRCISISLGNTLGPIWSLSLCLLNLLSSSPIYLKGSSGKMDSNETC